jgi:hypothetical protein
MTWIFPDIHVRLVTLLVWCRILVEMEDLINETWEDSAGRKSMSKVSLSLRCDQIKSQASIWIVVLLTF